MYKSFLFVLAILLTTELMGQSADSELTTREGQIQAQRLEKAGYVHPQKSETIDDRMMRIATAIQRSPFRILVEGRGPGAGFAIGYVSEWRNSRDQILSRLWGKGLLHGFYAAGTGLELRNFTRHDLSIALEGMYANAPQLEYYGPGPNSSIQNRTDFRREDTLFTLRFDLRTHRRLYEGCRVGELLVNVGPGTNGSLPTTESVFGPAQAPGIDVQSNFLIGGCSIALDLRDFPEDPHRGTQAAVTYDRYFAQDHNQFSFHRLNAVAEQYVPFLNQKRVIVFRARTEFSFHDKDQVVPFYLQPTLGSDEWLRGFRRYRFYDENSLALTGEYRWEVSTGFDMALFVDSGKVFNRPGQISLSEMENSAGFGLRIKNSHSVIARLDMGFSNEGFQVWLKFGKLF